MYFIEGKIIYQNEKEIIIKNQSGIGYKGYLINEKDIKTDYKVNDEILLYIYNLKNDYIEEMYLFTDYKIRNLFENLISIKQVGSKICKQIIESYSYIEFLDIIKNNQEDKITILKNIGGWTAKLIISELKLKLFNKKYTIKQNKLIDTLRKLGYKSSNIYKVIDKLDSKITDEILLQKALEGLSENV